MAYLTLSSENTALAANAPQLLLLDPNFALPLELFLIFLGYLDSMTLFAASAVSRRWRRQCLSPQLWKALYLQQGWKIRDVTVSNLPYDGLQSTQGSPLSRKRPSESEEIPWMFLVQQRTKLEENWATGSFSAFRLPQSKHPAEGHTGPVYAIRQYGKYLVSGGFDGTIRRWDLNSKRLIGTALEGHRVPVYSLHFEAEDDRIISGSSNGDIFVWKFSTGELLQSMSRAHDNAVASLHSHNRMLVTGGMDGSIKLWIPDSSKNDLSGPLDPRSHDPLILGATLNGHRHGVTAVTIHEGKIISYAGDLLVKVWSLDTGVCLRTLHDPHIVASVHFDGRIISGGAPRSIQMIDYRSGETIANLSGTHDRLRTAQAKFENKRCTRLISGSLEGVVTLWREGPKKTWFPGQQLRACGCRHTLEASHHKSASAQQTLASSASSNLDAHATGRPAVASLQDPRIRTTLIMQIQSDERKIICCSARSTIVGWDFGNSDKKIEVASQYFA